MKLCARCGRKWPVDGNFCPIDGSDLIEIPEEADEKEASEADDQAAADPATAVDETLGDVGWDEPADGAAKADPKKKPGGRDFSETQWFMLGADPESLVDNADKDDLENLQDKYGRDSSIPTDERKKFTLRSQEKLPADKGGKDGGEN
jgi:hypothetical protein